MLIIAVESPPGGGKGFLLKHLAAKGIAPLHGFVSLHDDAISHVLDMNTDPVRWGLFTELFFLHMHVSCYEKALTTAAAGKGEAVVVLLEGSPVSDRACYMLKQQQHLHPLEVELYEEWWSKLRPRWHVDHHILLLSDIHAHMERIIDNAKVEQAGLGLAEVHGLIDAFVCALPEACVITCPSNFEDNEPVLEHLRATMVRLLKHMVLEASPTTTPE